MCLALMGSMPGDHLKISMMVLGIAVPGVIYTLGHAIVSEITPPPQRGAMLAIHNAVITSAGLIGPYIMGSVVQTAGASPAEGYHRGFLICGVVAVTGGVAAIIFARPRNEIARFAATPRLQRALAE
jgi:MFS family permease